MFLLTGYDASTMESVWVCVGGAYLCMLLHKNTHTHTHTHTYTHPLRSLKRRPFFQSHLVFVPVYVVLLVFVSVCYNMKMCVCSNMWIYVCVPTVHVKCVCVPTCKRHFVCVFVCPGMKGLFDSQSPVCPVCQAILSPGEMQEHMEEEMARLKQLHIRYSATRDLSRNSFPLCFF